MIKFDASAEAVRLMAAIIDNINPPVRHRTTLMMSLEACHTNGCPLDLVRMVQQGKTSDVVHDVYGIDAHLNRETGQLEDCFWPRFALPS